VIHPTGHNRSFRKNHGSIPGNGMRFFFSLKRPDRLWSLSSLLLSRNGGSQWGRGGWPPYGTDPVTNKFTNLLWSGSPKVSHVLRFQTEYPQQFPELLPICKFILRIPVARFSLTHLTFWRRNYFFFLILAYSVYKTWIKQEPNKLELWNKLHFEERKKRRVNTMFKIFGTYICWINI